MQCVYRCKRFPNGFLGVSCDIHVEALESIVKMQKEPTYPCSATYHALGYNAHAYLGLLAVLPKFSSTRDHSEPHCQETENPANKVSIRLIL